MVRIIFFILLLSNNGLAQQPVPSTPDKLYGQLFIDVQLQQVFRDSKTFVDCVPLVSPADIMKRYEQEKNNARFDLKKFVLKYFWLPQQPKHYTSSTKNVRQHINNLWQVLKRSADAPVKGSSLLALPNAYIVPGGRFREIYYWDSYFTMLGLKESKEYGMMENMVNNFAYLINIYGHIPNGNRTYYVSRSQPPFFSMMVELLASVKGKGVYKKYADALQKEFSYWKNPGAGDSAVGYAVRSLEIYKGGDQMTVSKYSDDLDIPRQESFLEDYNTAEKAALEFRKVVRFADSNRLKRAVDSIKSHMYHNLRSAAASGWDFSSRWMINGSKISNTKIDDIIPVDLNCLVYHLKLSSEYSSPTHDDKELEMYTNTTKKNFRQLFFDEELGWYCDMKTDGKVMNNATLAGMYPLFFKVADKNDVPRIVAYLQQHFLKDGGVVTSLNNTDQQWDAPNGWAPLQWITIIGLENYGYHTLAKEIATRWVKLNKKVFASTGKLMEKYDVIDINKKAGGGEYPSQDGFGWTNGVLLALMNKYKLN
jgi:alpha,alpha-trehalase